MPEKWGWVGYGRDAKKGTTNRKMKNYAEIQNNEISWFVHDKKGDINIQEENLNEQLYVACTQRKITWQTAS